MSIKTIKQKFIISALAFGMFVPLSLSKGTFAEAATAPAGGNEPIAEKHYEFGTSPIPKSVGTFKGYDLRKRDINKNKLFLEDAPGAASNKRIAVVLHVGNNKHIEAAVAFGAEQFAHRVHDASFLILHDKDDDSSTATLSIYAHGRQYVIPVADGDNPATHNPWMLKLDDSMSQKDIAVKVYKTMQGAYNKLLAPRISSLQVNGPVVNPTFATRCILSS